MHIVYLTADDVVIRKLRGRIGDVSAAVFTVSRHGERGKNIAARSDPEKDAVVIVGFGSQRTVGRCKGLAAAVVQNAAAHLAVGCPAIRNLGVGRPELNCLRAVKARLGKPQEVVENDPPLALIRYLHRDAGHAELLVVNRVLHYAAICSAAGYTRYRSAAVCRLILNIRDDAQSAVAGCDILRGEIVQNILRETKLEQLTLYLLNAAVLSRLRLAPVHCIAAAKNIAQHAADQNDGAQCDNDALIRHFHRLRSYRISGLVKLAGELTKVADNADISYYHCRTDYQTFILHSGQHAHEGTPDDEGCCAFRARRKADLGLDRPQSLPEADKLGKHKNNARRRQGRCNGRRQNRRMENGRIQNECREEVGRADYRYGKACIKPLILAPQSAKAEQL